MPSSIGSATGLIEPSELEDGTARSVDAAIRVTTRRTLSRRRLIAASRVDETTARVLARVAACEMESAVSTATARRELEIETSRRLNPARLDCIVRAFIRRLQVARCARCARRSAG